jgi:N-acetylmuramoyl-L-alanine amidase
VYVLSEKGASSTQARLMAQRENNADMVGGVNLSKTKDTFLARTLLDLSQTATINDSMKVGRYLLGELGSVNRLHKAHVEQAAFAVLRAPDIPSVLIETAFISNPEEELRLKDDAYQEQMAVAIMRAVRQYFIKHPPGPKASGARQG